MTDANINRSVIKFICGEINNLCRLCLNSIDSETEKISLHEIALIRTAYYNDELSYRSVFQELGVTLEPALPLQLCVSCATLTVNSLLFQKLCEYSEQQWKTSLYSLNKIAQSKTLNNTAASVFINIENNEILTSSSSLPVKNKKNVIAELQKNMTIHIRRRDNEKLMQKFPCQICHKTFSKSYKLEDHKEAEHYPKTIQCDLCGKVFSTDRLLMKHKTLNHITLYCKVCRQEFSSNDYLKSHMNKHHKDCLKSSNQKHCKKPPKHLRKLKKKDQDTCPHCHKKFATIKSCKAHIHNCGQFICDMCSKEYTVRASLELHLACAHGYGTRILSCEWCKKTFLNSYSLKRHEVTHTKERKYSCEMCGNRFVSSSALVAHRRLHTGERPYPCDICSERFHTASKRKMHVRRAHLGPDKECEICSAKFLTNFHLKRHKSIHENKVAEMNPKSQQAKGKILDHVYL